LLDEVSAEGRAVTSRSLFWLSAPGLAPRHQPTRVAAPLLWAVSPPRGASVTVWMKRGPDPAWRRPRPDGGMAPRVLRNCHNFDDPRTC